MTIFKGRHRRHPVRVALTTLGIAAGVVGLGVGGLVLATAGGAGAITSPQLNVTLTSFGAHSSATWNTDGNPVLISGSGSTPCNYALGCDSAQVQINNVSGTQAPASSPTFTSSPAASAGDPRFVIEFHNGDYLFGDGTASNWDENPGGAQGVTYTTALNWALGGGLDNTVTAVFIVNDAGNPGVPVTLTHIQYGGATANAIVSKPVLIKNRHSGKCLNEDQNNNGATSQFTCSNIYVSLQWQTEKFADGTTYLQSVQTHNLLKSTVKGAQLTLTSIPAGNTTAFINGGIFKFPTGLVMDDAGNSTVNFTHVIGWPYNGQNNQRWDFTAVPA